MSITPIDLIASQLREAAPDADWNSKGVDRAIELAAMFQRAGFRTLDSLSIEAVNVWECFKLVGNAYDIVSQAEYDSLPRVSPTHKPVSNNSERSRLMFEFAKSPWRFSERWPIINDPLTGWYDEFGILRDPLVVLERRDYLPLRFANSKIGYLGDTHRDATIDGEKTLMKVWHGMPNIGWSSRGEGHVYYLVSLRANNKIAFVPVWQSSSAGDKAAARELVSAAVMIGSLGYALAGAGTLGSALGEKIVSTQFAATYPGITSTIGNVALNTAVNGGDVESAVKNAVKSFGATSIGVQVGGQVAELTSVDAFARVAQAATTAYIQGGDVSKAVGFAVLQSIPDAFPSGNAPMENLTMDWTTPIEASDWLISADPWGVSSLPGFAAPAPQPMPSMLDFVPGPLLDTGGGGGGGSTGGGFWQDTREWVGSVFTKENVRAARDVVGDVAAIVATVRAIENPQMPMPGQRAAVQNPNQVIRNPNGSITVSAPDGSVRVIPAAEVQRAAAPAAFQVTPAMLAVGGVALVGVLLLMRKR